jgi:putative methyltransferase
MSREYLSAGKILDAVGKGSNFKAVCNKSSTQVGKKDYLLASETLKYRSVLESVLKDAGVSSKRLDVGSHGTLLVLVYELLIGAGKIRGGGKVKRAVMSEIDSIKDSLAGMLKKNNLTSASQLLPESAQIADELPHFLRINTLKAAENSEQYAEVYKAIMEKCSSATVDTHVDNLIVIPPRSPSFGQHDLVKDGRIIIQDKASCFPSQILSDAWKDGDVIDACAAPGNKTSHVAAILTSRIKQSGCKGKVSCIYAFDKSPTRKDLLQSRMNSAGADMLVNVTNADFLTVDVNHAKYANVSAVLLDPSCSGSGLTAKDLGRLGKHHKDEARLEKLRAFQVQAILKAMTFPGVQLISYSTCSIYDEENESVVAEVLESRRQEGWHLVAPPRLASWKRRGHTSDGLSGDESKCLVRCDPSDGANGFFVALFERRAGVGGREEEEEEEEEEGDEKQEESRADRGAQLVPSPRKRRRIWVPLHRKGAHGW